MRLLQTTQARFNCVLLVLLTACIATVASWYELEQSRFWIMSDELRSGQSGQVKRTLAEVGRLPRAFAIEASHNPEWTALLNQPPTPEFLQRAKISANLFKTDFVWIVKPNYDQVHSFSTHTDLKAPPVSSQFLRGPLSGRSLSNVFQMHGAIPIELNASPIMSGDTKLGYVVTGRRWDKAFLNQIGTLAGVRFAVRLSQQSSRYTSSDPGRIRTTSGLTGPGGKVSAYLEATSYDRTLAMYEHQTLMVLAGFLAVLAGSFVAVWVFVKRSIIQPILDLSESSAKGRKTARLSRLAADDLKSLRSVLEHARQTEAEGESLRQQVTESQEAKSNFLASVSHEIRTPLNGIVGMAQHLADTPLDSYQRESIDIIQTCSASLMQILNDSLDFARMEAGKFPVDLTDVPVGDLVEEVSGLFAATAQQKGVEIVCNIDSSVPAVVRTDGLRVRQILSNLIGNAVKFTAAGEIEVRAHMAAGSAHVLILEVRDTGIGIPQDRLHSIFDSFSQADTSTTRKYGGTGLGLAICRKLAELLDGRLTVQSEPGKGSTFSLLLPVAVIVRGGSPELESSTAKVLLVDDNETNRRVIGKLVTGLGYSVTTVSSMEEALLAEPAQYDVILTDFMMPEHDGTELLAKLKEAHGDATPPVILLSSAKQNAAQAQALGFHGVALKPVKKSQLSTLIEGALCTVPPKKNLAPLILVAEDNDRAAELLCQTIENLQLVPIRVSSGRAAIQEAEERRFAAIILDAFMPDVDGFEAALRIRAYEQQYGLHTPILGMSSNLDEEREKFLAAGAQACIPKPVTAQSLTEAIEQHGSFGPIIVHQPSLKTPEGVEQEESLNQMNLAVWTPEVLMDGPGADAEFVVEMTSVFLDQADELYDDVRLAGDERSRKLAAHALKGAAAAVGGQQLAAFCQQLEGLAYVGPESWSEHMATLKIELDQMIRQFHAWQRGAAA